MRFILAAVPAQFPARGGFDSRAELPGFSNFDYPVLSGCAVIKELTVAAKRNVSLLRFDDFKTRWMASCPKRRMADGCILETL
jgi:hypothetical protein